ncbi:MAG: sodium:glutamate symporter [Spirochaetales bacterium]|nr:sodium:glutamate symporter [Spirochaetales bacterium]
MDFPWMTFVNFGVISAALLLGTLIRARVRFFQKFLIPNALTAGFILLLFYNYAAPHIGMTQEDLGGFAYHLLNISFIAMVLRKPAERSVHGKKRTLSMAVLLLSGYAIQAVLGLVVTFFFIFTIMPDLFPAIGYLVPLGFSSGPGQAFAIAQVWEAPEFGFAGAGSVGLTFGALGFLWACFGGVFLINIGVRRGWVKRSESKINGKSLRSGFFEKDVALPIGSRLTTETEAIDTMTYNAAGVLLVYLLTYLLLKVITWLLAFLGPMGNDLASSLWGIGFIFCALTAMVVRKFIAIVKIHHTFDNGSLTRVAGLSIDYMVAAALGAISIVVVKGYWLPILVMSTLAGILALVIIPWVGSRMFPDNKFGRTMIVYGASTGTLATGLALLRVIDPDFESPVASDYMPASAIVFVFAIPLILQIHLPAYAFRDNRPELYWLSLGICLVYVALTAVGYLLLAKKNRFRKARKLWLAEEET